MKKLTLLFFFTVLVSSVLFSQSTNKYNYCFFVKIAENIEKDEFKIVQVSNEVDSCEHASFVKIQKNKTKNGFITIGPFLTFNEAQNSLNVYSFFVRNFTNIDNILEEETPFYWYLLSCKINAKNNKIVFERFPAAITSGNIENFMLTLNAGMLNKKMMVGPFENYMAAEMSKMKNRKLEKKNFITFHFENSKIAVNRMKNDIDKVKFNVQNTTLHNDTINFDLNIQFPDKYFHERVYMFLKLSINDKNIKTVSLQGDEIRDNNAVIPYQSARNYRINCTQKVNENETLKLMVDIIISNEKYRVKNRTIEIEIPYNK